MIFALLPFPLREKGWGAVGWISEAHPPSALWRMRFAYPPYETKAAVLRQPKIMLRPHDHS